MRPERLDTTSEAEASFVNTLAAQSITTTGGRDTGSQITSTGGQLTSTGGPLDAASQMTSTGGRQDASLLTSTLQRVPLYYYGDDDEMPPHFDVVASSRRRRMPAAVAAAIRRRLSRSRTIEKPLHSSDGSEGASSPAAAEATMVTDAPTQAGTARDSEFGTGFLNVDLAQGSGCASEGCAEAAAEVAMSAVSSAPREDAASTVSSASLTEQTATGATQSTTTFVRLVSRARRALRPLSLRSMTLSGATATTTSGRTRSTKTTNAGITTPPKGITFEEFTLDGEKRIGLCREPSMADLCEEFQIMKERFPDVPKFAGNPPWLTRFHPDLIRPPTTMSVGTTIHI